jgi:hypothetical protein
VQHNKYTDKAKNPQQQADYEAKFGPFRFATGIWEIDVSASSTEPQPTVPFSTNSTAWNISISWANESLKIKIPRKWKHTLKTFFTLPRPRGSKRPKKFGSGVACSKNLRLRS